MKKLICIAVLLQSTIFFASTNQENFKSTIIDIARIEELKKEIKEHENQIEYSKEVLSEEGNHNSSALNPEELEEYKKIHQDYYEKAEIAKNKAEKELAEIIKK